MLVHDPFTSRSSGEFSDGTPILKPFLHPSSSYVPQKYSHECLSGDKPSKLTIVLGISGLIAYVLYMSTKNPGWRNQ